MKNEEIEDNLKLLSKLELEYQKCEQGPQMSGNNLMDYYEWVCESPNSKMSSLQYYLPYYKTQFSQQETDASIMIGKYPVFLEPKERKYPVFMLIYIYKGDANIRLVNNEYFLRQGDLLLIRPDTILSIQAEKDAIILQIAMEKSLFEDDLLTVSLLNELFYEFFSFSFVEENVEDTLFVRTGGDEYIKNILLIILGEYLFRKKNKQFILVDLIIILFSALLNGFEESLNIDRPELKKYSHLVKALRYMVANSQTVTLDVLSQELCLSKQQVCRIFKKYTGSKFIFLLNKIRLKRSCQMLRFTDLSLEDVSRAIGFESTTYFIRLFKSVYGITPNVFRKSKISTMSR